jgi:hypothetical protein
MFSTAIRPCSGIPIYSQFASSIGKVPFMYAQQKCRITQGAKKSNPCNFSIKNCSEAVHITNFLPVLRLVRELSPKALVALDVDQTLIRPKDTIVDERYYTVMQDIFKRLGSEFSLSKESLAAYQSRMYLSAEQQVIDPISQEVMAELHSRKIKVIAITALNRGSFGEISNVLTWRADQLKKHGFHFSLDEHCFQFKYLNAGLPAYKDGIMLSSSIPKGLLLREFIDRTSTPSEVVFVDDLEKNVQSVKTEMAKKNIPTKTFIFDSPKPLLDEKNAELQIRHLIQYNTWHCQTQYKKL